MKEYAFDVKLAAVVRLNASSEQQARSILERVLDCIDYSRETLDDFSDARLTEVSICVDDANGPMLFEIDGEPT